MSNFSVQKKGLDSPPGNLDYIQSAITGGLIRYFTPYPLSTLLEACLGFQPEVDDHVFLPDNSSLCIGRCLSLRSGAYDSSYSSIYIDGVRNGMNLKTAPSLMALFNKIHGGGASLRDEMVFADGPTASHASIVYAHHDQLPDMFSSCANVLRDWNWGSGNDYVSSCVIGFYCLKMHPFRDGNGRWARMMVALSHGDGGGLDAALCSLFLLHYKKNLANDVWARSMHSGLRDYLEMACSYRSGMRLACKEIFLETAGVIEVVDDFFGNGNFSKIIIKKIFSMGYLNVNEFRAKYKEQVSELIGILLRNFNVFRRVDGGLELYGVWNRLEEKSFSFGLRMNNMERF